MDEQGYQVLAAAVADLQTSVDELRRWVAMHTATEEKVERMMPIIQALEAQRLRDEGAELARADMRPVVLHDEPESIPIWRDADGRAWALAMVTRGGLVLVLVSMALVGGLNAEHIAEHIAARFGG
ncbi:MAG: hypothetical protein GY913_32690 [Proteobacteria bacterium]|nr:hypothetical protein [Pseudomonadota bacterium]